MNRPARTDPREPRAHEPEPRDPETPPGEPEPPPTRTTADPQRTRAFAIDAARALRDDKCEDVVVLDVRGMCQVTDFIVIASGTSERQMGAAIESVEDIGREHGFAAFRKSEDRQTLWLLADFVDVVIHLFEPNTRAHYDLEMLWGDAERIPWDSGAPGVRARAGGAASEPDAEG